MDSPSFLFSSELSYLMVLANPRLGSPPKIGGQLPQRPLAGQTFTVDNSPAWSLVTRRTTALDRETLAG